MTCSTCSAASVRTLGSGSYCEVCANAILDPIRERVILPTGFDGTGREISPRPDCRNRWADLECSVCSATWTGRTGESCGWCEQRYKSMLAEQRDLLIHPSLPEPTDQHFDRAVDSWVERIGRGVLAGIVTESDARRAVERFEVRHAA
jgi:hypothetical protein